ncbi:hypothetical protein CO229_00065 [Mycoplasmopsis bovirhinis]|uniref:IS3 family transposase n=1 Tax=Mycoplasmopsis bovirhinis TaxID=29553 RepID=UPI000C05B102|nr:IS3 family transposase [Mycoplasmopsis bovirhinis]ATO30533.1 hypothetical protein CO229_00065 [Mycoplasmopsis bovirhinis]
MNQGINIKKSTYFYILRSFLKDDKDFDLKEVIRKIFKENKSRYGYWRIYLELRNRGYIGNYKKVKN